MEGETTLRRNRLALFFIVAGLILISGLSAKSYLLGVTGKTLYLSPSGSDSADGIQTNPLKTLGKAQEIVRKNRFKDATIFLHGGTYQLTDTLNFTKEDSGLASSAITYRAYPGEKPIISGSQFVSGFSKYSDNIMVADLSSTLINGNDVKDLYLNNQAQTLARTPNYLAPDFSKNDPYQGTYYSTNGSGNFREISYDSNALNNKDWTNVTAAQVVIFPGNNQTNDIRNIDTILTGKITLTADTSSPILTGNRFYVQNLFQALDAPGEWYFDQASKKLYFYPPRTLTDEDSFSISRTATLVSLVGTKNIAFEGITFEQSLADGVVVENSDNIKIVDCELRNTLGNAVTIQGTSNNVSVSRNIIHETGGAGVSISTSGKYFKNLVSPQIDISNNQIKSVGGIHNNRAGIEVQSVGSRIANNTISDTPGSGIIFKGNNNQILNNLITRTGRALENVAGIATPGKSWLEQGNLISENVISQTGGYTLSASGRGFNSGSSGILLDNFASGDTIQRNTIKDAPTGIIVRGGISNDINHNIIVDTSEYGLELIAIELSSTTFDEAMYQELTQALNFDYLKKSYLSQYPTLSNILDSQDGQVAFENNQILNNIFYYPSTDSLLFSYAGKNIFNNNLYRSSGRLLVKNSLGSISGFEEWLSMGYDKNSVTNNPGFVDPSENNFNLLEQSPALELGFSVGRAAAGILEKTKVIIDNTSY